MRSFTITEETFEPVMFRRLHQEVQSEDKSGINVIAYIEDGKQIFVRDDPFLIKGIADRLTLQGAPFRIFTNEQVENCKDIFTGLARMEVS
jgi:hypothetical protein